MHSFLTAGRLSFRWSRFFRVFALAAPVLLFGLPADLAAQSGASIKLTEYPVPTSMSQPYAIAVGSDGALWFTEPGPQKIGRVTTTGSITEYTGLSAPPSVITSGSDGALWFAESNSTTAVNYIGRITTSGALTEFPLPAAYPGPGGIVSGPDGAIWFTETGLNEIGRITTAGAITSFPIPSPAFSGPNDITDGPDGALWFTEGTSYSNQYEIERITTDGVITSYSLPTNSEGFGIATGSDGALWFTEYDAQKIGRITTAGALTEYGLQTAKPAAQFITAGPDGALWFTEQGGDKVARITTTGVLTEYPLTSRASPQGIVAGPSLSGLWFAERYGKIARVPACGLGLSLSYSAGTLTMNFDVGLNFGSLFATTLTTTGSPVSLFSKQIPALVPPDAFQSSFSKGLPSSGTATITSTLSNGEGTNYCQEYQSVVIP